MTSMISVLRGLSELVRRTMVRQWRANMADITLLKISEWYRARRICRMQLLRFTSQNTFESSLLLLRKSVSLLMLGYSRSYRNSLTTSFLSICYCWRTSAMLLSPS